MQKENEVGREKCRYWLHFLEVLIHLITPLYMDTPRENPLLFLREEQKIYVLYTSSCINSRNLFSSSNCLDEELPSEGCSVLLPGHLLHLFYLFFMVANLKTFIQRKTEKKKNQQHP